ncbi:Leucine-rich repeat-containing G-protein coupled receptor 5 [Pseudolycoriella hygida]|uniref:Leucine-rich repeat-containing G-protein coupled receptor 5 n=1 Tax=Pseudolycoriella hygida TaxID=35572 RepID=A0A9Q0MWA1_9DIPT|nr:Leucine-rich repeat-containing G-protein coupled receptor 5 [Pseudolycoriella hygida]
MLEMFCFVKRAVILKCPKTADNVRDHLQIFFALVTYTWTDPYVLIFDKKLNGSVILGIKAQCRIAFNFISKFSAKPLFVKSVLIFCGLSSLLVISSGLIINCDYVDTVQGDLGTLYTCLSRVVFVGDSRTVTQVSENHLDGRNSSSVQAIIYNQTLNFFPRNVSEFFPNIQIIYANFINSSELYREDLKGFEDLRSFRFGNNNLKEIENDLFTNNLLLTSVYFEHNPITHVGHSVFSHLNNLNTLYMYNTSCMNRFAANNRIEVERLVFSIIIECPPTLQMTEDKIVNGIALTNQVQSHIESAFQILYSKIEAIEEHHSELEKRIEILEQNSNSTLFSPHH